MTEKTLGYITRKSMLYKTAVEYGDYTMNHVLGCSHGCLYPCYAFLIAMRFKKVTSYTDWLEPKLVENTLELLETELPRYKHNITSVQLCFTTDPFMLGYPEITEVSLAAIKRINQEGIPCNILTKGILPKELSVFSVKNEYGITLISTDEEFRSRIEPGALNYDERIFHLKYLHDQGCRTWVSIEPYPTPNINEQSIHELLDRISFVDKIIFGRMNYNKAVTNYPNHNHYYKETSSVVEDFCSRNNIKYVLKRKTIKQ